MLAWLRSLFGLFGGSLAQIWNATVNVVINTYNSLVVSELNIWKYAEEIFAALFRVAIQVSNFIGIDYHAFVRYVQSQFARQDANENRDYNRLIGIINSLRLNSQKSVTVVQENLDNGLAALLRWVITHIFDPLFSGVTKALDWIENEGAFVFGLLTNLEKFADLIMGFLWSGWLVLFRKYAKAIVSYILVRWKAIIPDVASVLEDIIASLF